MNYYELFGLKVLPIVEKGHLAKKYFELQRQFHPDFHTALTEEERLLMLEKSAEVNKAFNTFKDPQLTLEYFLRIKGLINEDEKYRLPDDFLMEMMDFNEGLMGMDKEEAQRNLAQLEMGLYEEIRDLIVGDREDITDTEMLAIKEYYYKKKYLQRILDRLAD